MIEIEPLSRSALVIPAPDPAKGNAVGMVVSQVLTDWPIETHVFTSLLYGHVPIYVATANHFWKVVGDRVTMLPRE